MPWVKAMLRGQVVFARATASGELDEQGGRVEVRYKPNDGRLYQAGARNLAIVPGPVLPDETCGPAAAVDKAKKTEAASPGDEQGGAGGRRVRAGASGSSAGASGSSAGSAAPRARAADTVIVFTDGACSGNPGPAGLGMMLEADGRVVERSEYLGSATNNIAELTAILRALEELDSPELERAGGEKRPAEIHTDSQYSIGVLQKGWKAKANQELVAVVKDKLRAHRSAVLVYVKGHAGHPGNERADELARRAIQSRRSVRDVREPKAS
jgi:ribonuclease HI